jgi:hypothetical protein
MGAGVFSDAERTISQLQMELTDVFALPKLWPVLDAEYRHD